MKAPPRSAATTAQTPPLRWPGPSRRAFIAGSGAIVVAFGLRPRLGVAADAQNATAGGPAAPSGAPAPELPGSLKTQPVLDGWVRIDADGTITVFTGKAELGQGIKSALIQVAAEELVVEPSRIRLVTADTERTANEGYTAGSHSMQDSGTAIRHAAAQVRAILLAVAAERSGLPAAQLMFENGVIRGPTGQRMTYAELAAGQSLHVEAQPQSVLIDPRRHRVVGKPMARVDIPAKVSGGAAYVQDLRLPGMLHARVVRPPSPAAALEGFDSSRVERLPGVHKVVRDGRFIGVVAQREFQAVLAMRAAAAAARSRRA